MKYCIIRRVPFRRPGKKSRVVWAHILAESEGLALVLVPKPEIARPHSILIAEENTVDHVFQPVGPNRFDLETEDLNEAGDKLRILGKSFSNAEILRRLRFDDFGTSDL